MRTCLNLLPNRESTGQPLSAERSSRQVPHRTASCSRTAITRSNVRLGPCHFRFAHQSFPRKREPREDVWIPASAGMTGCGSTELHKNFGNYHIRNKSSISASESPATRRSRPFILVFALLVGLTFSATVAAQTDPSRPQQPAPGTAAPGQTFAPIGESGYQVPIPEFKMKNLIGGPPKQEAPAAPQEEKRTPAPSVEAPKAKPVPKEMPVPQVPRLPFEPVDRGPKVEAGQEAPPAKETPTKETPTKGTREKEYESPLLKAPIIPEDITAGLPLPRKEVLPKTGIPGSPSLMDAEPVKEGLKTIPLERTEIDDMADPRLWIPLEPRREAEAIVPEPEPEPAAPIQREEARPELTPKESESREAIPQPLEQPVEPKESIPTKEEAPPVKESISSPLGRDAAENPEVGAYLKATAPILEELSLLMARTPSLTVADYDPSEANAPVFPKELIVKMDSLKRELQILDSKTFEIIPPAKYAPFHSIIRQSITQTYQACDEIINYFSDRKEQSLQKVQEHLLKARELIQKTREQT